MRRRISGELDIQLIRGIRAITCGQAGSWKPDTPTQSNSSSAQAQRAPKAKFRVSMRGQSAVELTAKKKATGLPRNYNFATSDELPIHSLLLPSQRPVPEHLS
jgi:hypothetical protein